MPALSFRKLAAVAWNHLPLDFAELAVTTISTTAGEGAAPPLNKLCDVHDWSDPNWRRCLVDLGYLVAPALAHRKEWEFAQVVYGLRSLRRLSPTATALGLGAGHESLIYFLARRLKQVIATDLYAGSFSDEEADPAMLTRPQDFAPYPYPSDRLTVRSMDARKIDYPDQEFDIVFSLSSIEHFGSRTDQLRCLREIRRVLKPGGLAALTTEIILNKRGFHGDYFRLGELLDDLIPRSGLELVRDPFSFATSAESLANPVQLPEARQQLPHLVCRRWNTLFTSASFFLQRTGEAMAAMRNTAREIDCAMRATLLARIEPHCGTVEASAGAPIEIPVTVTNVGEEVWMASPGTHRIGPVRLGAHLLDASDTMIIRDYGRADLPSAVAPGQAVAITLYTTAPSKLGTFTVELDMVKEQIAWFSSAGPSNTSRLGLTVS